jgi:hypothetical protein
VVTAIDITHDPAHGVDARKLAETLVASRDRRIKYIISNAQIISSKESPWVWRPYNGANAHRAHVHVSVVGDQDVYDDDRDWQLATAVAKPTVSAALRQRMAKAIVDAEARREQGRLVVYRPPANDGGGAYEVAGINVRHHPNEAEKLKALIDEGRHEEADAAARDYVLVYTNPVTAWHTDPGVEFYLRDCFFNRGPRGAARILQRAVGVNDDGVVGHRETLPAVAKLTAAQLLTALREGREDYERNVVGVRANLWNGLVNRWNNALKLAREFSAEAPPVPGQGQDPLLQIPTSGQTGNPALLLAVLLMLLSKEKPMADKPGAPGQPDLAALLAPLLVQLLTGKPPAPPPAPPPPPPPPQVATTQPDLAAILQQLLAQRLSGKPPEPAPDSQTPVLTRPSVQLSAAGLGISTILQALGVVGTPFGMGDQPTATGTLATLVPIVTSLIGATGGFGSLLSIAGRIFGGLAQRPK